MVKISALSHSFDLVALFLCPGQELLRPWPRQYLKFDGVSGRARLVIDEPSLEEDGAAVGAFKQTMV